MSVDKKILCALYPLIARMAGSALLYFSLCQTLLAAIEVRPQSSHSKLFNHQNIVSSELLSSSRIKKNSLEEIPVLRIPKKPEWVELYNGAWKILLNNLRTASEAEFPASEIIVSDYIDEGYSDDSLFQWDSIFAVHTARYLGKRYNFIGTLDNFYSAQHSSGFISRELSEKTGGDVYFKENPVYPWFFEMLDRRFHQIGFKMDPMKEFYDVYIHDQVHPIENSDNPPLFAWAELEYSHFHLNIPRLKQVAKVLERHLEWLETSKVRSLPIQRNAPDTTLNLFHQTPLGSGMDNIPLTGDGWVDLSSQMFLAYEQLARIYQKILNYSFANPADDDLYYARIQYSQEKAAELKHAINACLWSEQHGTYFNVKGNCSKKINVYTLASFWPMFAGIASKEQAEAMVNILFDPAHFYTKMPFPTLSKKETTHFKPQGGYWQGGVWAPTNYMVIRGLMNYGYTDKAREATTRYLDALAASYRKTRTLYEYYSISGERGYDTNNKSLEIEKRYARDNFVGWSGLGPISLMIELIVGVRFTAPETEAPEEGSDTLYWDLSGTEEVSLDNLNFNGKRLSFYKSRRFAEDSNAFVYVTVNGLTGPGPQRLVIIHQHHREEILLTPSINGKFLEIPAYPKSQL